MKMWQYFGLLTAIWMAPHKTGPINMVIGILFLVASAFAMAVDA